MASNTPKVQVGIIGAGNIAPQYIYGCRAFEVLNLTTIADLDTVKAESVAAEHGLKAVTVDALLADPDVQIIINLTVPKVHAAVSSQIIGAGKHAYSEKPLGVERAEGQLLMNAAQAAGVRVGCAPDTFLGGGLQTVRKLIDDGVIGEPIGATAFMMSHGPESWHPNPDFFYKSGGGPLFDMGPYYITALVHLLGGVRRVSASARISFPERTATSPALMGHKIAVEIPTHYSMSLDFAAGAVATMVMSFDVWQARLPRIEVYGSEGTISVPDPNTFTGPVQVWTAETKTWQDVSLTHSDQVGRGIGVADMAYSVLSGRAHRASGELALHVVDVMQSVLEASDAGRAITIETDLPRPTALPTGLQPGTLDE